MTENYTIMANDGIKIKGKYRIHLQGLPFQPRMEQIFFYDPQPDSYLSYVIEDNFPMIRSFFSSRGFEFYCFSDFAQQLTDEMVRYRFPNWKNQPLKKVGNDLLRAFLVEEDRDIGASFIRLYDNSEKVYSCYQLYHPDTYSLMDQLEFYGRNLQKKEESYIRYSVSFEAAEEMPVCEDRFNFADDNFEEESQRLNKFIADLVAQLHQQNVGEFVLRCLVPVEEKLSRLVVTKDYDIVLPDYSNEPIPLYPLYKAIFLLFLCHEEGIYFKELMDYRDELRDIYSKISNRTTDAVVDKSLDAATDPTANAINVNCSRIREAFLGRMDERIAKNYYVTGKRAERKRITLPRNLVEWQCEL